MANCVENDGFRSWFRKLFRVVGAAGPAPSLVWLCSGLFLLAPLLAGAGLFVAHDMAPSLVFYSMGRTLLRVSFPRFCVAGWETLQCRRRCSSRLSLCAWDFAGLSVAPPVVALLCAQGWKSPLLRWLLVVIVCDFVFFLAPRGIWLVGEDERDFDVSLKGLFGAPALGFLIKKGLAAAMLAAPLAAMKWSMPACSRICPPCSQSTLMLPLHAACFAAFLWPHRHTNLVVPYSWWKESGIGEGKGEKKAGRSNLCLGLWLVLLLFQVGISSFATASEAALVGILKLVGWQLPAAASLSVTVFGVVFVAAAAMCGIFTIDCDFSFLGFDFSLIEESGEFIPAAASVAALVSGQQEWIVAAAASVGPIAFVVCYQFFVDILWSHFASVQVEATPRVDVDETRVVFRLS